MKPLLLFSKLAQSRFGMLALLINTPLAGMYAFKIKLLIFIAFFHISSQVLAQTKYNFNIEAQRADTALTLFAQQANTTLLFPYDLAEKEQTNALHGEYTVELGIVKLLEGTGLFPVADSSGLFSVKPIVEDSKQPDTESDPPELTKEELLEYTFDSELEKIAVVGTRAAPRSVIESPVPLDVIVSDEFMQQGATDVMSMMSALIPSFNVNDQPINDASSLVRPANLRGMASDHTLVLLNGKRRHRSAVITFLGGGLSDGAQGPDISTLPASALKQVEVLRDGAAAQYGSDAIAGVINFVLKDDAEGGMLEARFGSYMQGDGELLQVQGNAGFQLGQQGFANLSGEFRIQNDTSRSVQRGDAQLLVDAGNLYVDEPAQIWGSPKVNYDIKLAGNFALQLTDSTEGYAFYNFAEREIEGGFYYRNPHTRSGVNDGGTDENGNRLLLVGDLDGLNNGIECPSVTITDNNVLDDDDYLLIADSRTEVGRNCFAFNEILPGGFTPKFGGIVSDASFYTGVRGETDNDWAYDISVSIGYSNIDYEISNTINPSLGASSPNHFKPGSATQIEKNFNIDVAKQFHVGLPEPLNLAAGLEWRRENFKQAAGDPASYLVGPLAFDPISQQSIGFGIGSNGFPGYKPETAGNWGRGNWAMYTDWETHIHPDLLVGLAFRYEDFTDFGSTFDGKVSTRYQLTNNIAMRGSMSTGFKAPTVGQSNVINVTTAFSSGGLEDQATLPPTNPISLQLGATPLNPEESVNMSLGVVGKFSNKLFVTLDYFNIRLKDRLSTTSALPLSQSDINVLLAQGVRDAASFSSAKYFTNDFDTTTQGIDVVANYETQWFGAETKLTLAYNWTNTSVDRVTEYQRTDIDGNTFIETNLTQQRIRMLEDNLPESRGTFTIKQQFDSIRSLYRINYYSGFYEDHLDASAGFDIYSGSEVTLDVEFGFNFTPQFQIAAGAKNVFNNHPDENPYYELVGAKYPPTSPLGINGGFYYLRGIFAF